MALTLRKILDRIINSAKEANAVKKVENGLAVSIDEYE